MSIRRLWVNEPSDDDIDFEDVDCEDCGHKFFVRPSSYKDKPWPARCDRCRKSKASWDSWCERHEFDIQCD